MYNFADDATKQNGATRSCLAGLEDLTSSNKNFLDFDEIQANILKIADLLKNIIEIFLNNLVHACMHV